MLFQHVSLEINAMKDKRSKFRIISYYYANFSEYKRSTKRSIHMVNFLQELWYINVPDDFFHINLLILPNTTSKFIHLINPVRKVDFLHKKLNN